jgi:Heliorhodopsin
MLCNINNAAILIPIIAINACMNLFGASMEMHNSTLKSTAVPITKTTTLTSNNQVIETKTEEASTYTTNWSHFIYGCFAGAIPWVVMGVYFFTSLGRLSDIDSLPDEVKDILKLVRFIFPMLFIFFNLFAINMFLQYKKIGPWKTYLFGEKSYIILSLLAKSFLAWFIWGGTLR